MFRRLWYGVTVFCCAVLVVGCSVIQGGNKDSKPGVKYSAVYGPAKPTEILESSVTQTEFQESLGTGRGVHGARFVEVFRRSGGHPEWRIFDVHDGDPYTLIGMREGDMLVAANDWIIFDPQRFRTYVELLRTGFDASVLVRRDGALIELKPRISDLSSAQEGV